MTVAVPVAPRPGRSTTWWGMMLVIATEATLFACLLAAWFFLRAASKDWPPAGVELPDLSLSIPFSFVLWGSSIPVVLAERALERGRIGWFQVGMALARVLGAAFLAFTAYDFHELHFGWQDHAYGTAFYVIVGLTFLSGILGMAGAGRRHAPFARLPGR